MAKKERKIAVVLNTDEITLIVANICSECYGVIGLSQTKTVKGKSVKIKSDSSIDGIIVNKEKGGFSIEVHIICAYGIKITEIVNSVSRRVSFALKRKYGELFNKTSVFVEELREL